jgi:hypothetical protein
MLNIKNIIYTYIFNYELVKCGNCNYEIYIKRPVYGTYSCSNSCTFELYNKYKSESESNE